MDGRLGLTTTFERTVPPIHDRAVARGRTFWCLIRESVRISLEVSGSVQLGPSTGEGKWKKHKCLLKAQQLQKKLLLETLCHSHQVLASSNFLFIVTHPRKGGFAAAFGVHRTIGALTARSRPPPLFRACLIPCDCSASDMLLRASQPLVQTSRPVETCPQRARARSDYCLASAAARAPALADELTAPIWRRNSRRSSETRLYSGAPPPTNFGAEHSAVP